MELNDYQTRASSTKVYPTDAGLIYTVLGLVGEAGEVANKVKKIIRDDGGRLSTEASAAVASELGDVLWYVAAVASELGYSLDMIAQRNLTKLADRAANGTLRGSGDTR